MITIRLKRGFTLVETMVAIAVLAIALVGPFVAIQTSLNASYIARDELIASSLAQEGMEYVRSVRDNNYLNGRTWLDGITAYSQCYNGTGYCMIDSSQGDIHTDSPNNSAMQHYANFSSIPYLYLSSGYIYNQQGSGTVTRFKRGIQITSVRNDPLTGLPIEVRVVVTVSWVSAHSTYSVVVTDTLQDWI